MEFEKTFEMMKPISRLFGDGLETPLHQSPTPNQSCPSPPPTHEPPLDKSKITDQATAAPVLFPHFSGPQVVCLHV